MCIQQPPALESSHKLGSINDLLLCCIELHASVPSNNQSERETVISCDANGADEPLDLCHYSLSESLIRFGGLVGSDGARWEGISGPVGAAARSCTYRIEGCSNSLLT